MIKPKSPTCKKEREIFPDPSLDFEEGLVAVSKDINPEMLFESYSFGVFPWPHEGYDNLWFCPERRGVLDFKEIHIPRSLNKFLKTNSFKVTCNSEFDSVIEECAKAKRKEQSGTWITDDILNAYKDFHTQGYAHSVECWDNNNLVGGMYGVFVNGYFSGESMFFKKT